MVNNLDMDVSGSVPHNPETDWRRHHDEETDLIDHDIWNMCCFTRLSQNQITL